MVSAALVICKWGPAETTPGLTRAGVRDRGAESSGKIDHHLILTKYSRIKSIEYNYSMLF